VRARADENDRAAFARSLVQPVDQQEIVASKT
jgi:hypothetical protein